MRKNIEVPACHPAQSRCAGSLASRTHGQAIEAWGDTGCECTDERPDVKAGVRWHIAMRTGKRREMDKSSSLTS